MNKTIKILLIVVLVVILAAMCVCLVSVFNDGFNLFNNMDSNDNQNYSIVLNTPLSLSLSDNVVTYGYIGGVQFNLSNDGSIINISGAFVGENAYLEVSINSSNSYSVGSSLYSNVVFDDYYEGMSFGTINLTDLISAGTLSYDTQYYLFARDTKAGSWVSIMDFTVVSVSTELPEPPTKIGYTFTGWYVDEDCTILYEEDYVNGNMTLYAGWRANTYNVVFNSNGGTGEVVKQSFSYDEVKKLQDVKYEKQFYKLIGWSTSEDGEVVFNLQEAVSNLSSTDGDTIQLYAVWERVSYLVTFIVDGNTYAKVEVEAGTNIADVLNTNFLSVLFYISDDELEGLPDTLIDDVTINLQKTFLGNIVTQDWFLPVAISACVLFVIGILSAIVLKRKGGV